MPTTITTTRDRSAAAPAGAGKGPARLPIWTGPAVLAVLLAAGLLSLLVLRPPAPRPATAPADEFSAERARAHLGRIAAEPRPVGSAAHARVREYLVGELRALGLETSVQARAWVPEGLTWVRAAGVRNIVARLPGTDPTGALGLVSHYDSEVRAPGAGDAGAAVASILEAVRAIRAAGPLRNDLVVLLTDAEEIGLIGARAFLRADTAADSLAVVLNFEGRGSRGPSLMFEPGPDNGPLIRVLARAGSRPIASSLFPEAYAHLPNSTDFSAFLAAGRTGLNFAHASGADAYHMPFDSPDRVPDSTLQHHGEHAVALAHALGNADLAGTRGDDVTYFNVPGIGLVLYPMAWALPLAGLTALLLGGIATWGIRGRIVTLGGVAAGTGAFLGVAGLAALLGWGLWRLSAAVHPEAGTLIGQRLYDEVPHMSALVALVVALAFAAYLLLRRRFTVPSLVLGALVVPAGLAVVVAVLAPGATYLLTVPALSGLAGAAWLVARGSRGGAEGAARADVVERDVRGRDVVVLMALALPAILVVVPHYPLFLIGLSIMFAPLFGPLVLLAVVPALPLLGPLSRPNRWWLPALSAAVGLLFLAGGLLGAGAADSRPAPANLVYLMDGDAGEAWWATAQPPGTRWLDRYVPDDTVTGELQIFDWIPLFGRRTYRAAPALIAPLEAPAVQAVPGPAGTDGVQRKRLEIRRPPDALGMILAAADTGWLVVGLEGRPLLPHPRFWRLELWDDPPDGAWTLDLLALLPDRDPAPLSLVTIRAGLPRLAGPPADTSADTPADPLARPADLAPTGVFGGRAALTDLTVERRTLVP